MTKTRTVGTLAELTIRLNGDACELAGPLTVAQLLDHLGLDPRRVAVERNVDVVKRPAYDTTVIVEGDEIEIVNFVGGGASRADGGSREGRER